MAKIVEATCAAGVVQVGELPIPGTTILGEGVGESEGILLLEVEQRTYIPKTTPDLKTTLGKIADALSQIASALTAIDAKPTGGTGSAPVPTVAANVTAINALRTDLATLKEALK